MNRLKFIDKHGRPGVFVINQKSSLKRGNYHFHAWSDSPARLKMEVVDAGGVLTGKRQARVYFTTRMRPARAWNDGKQ